MFKLYSYLFLFFIIPSTGHAQNELKKYVKSEITQFSDVSTATPDFLSIQKAIGNSRIVMLGEQSHGDGTTFQVKTELIKYLHEQLGFNVLAFESDFFALTEGGEHIGKDRESIAQFIKGNLYPLWSYSEECRDLLYEYIPDTYQTAHPLLIAGIDNQMHGRYTADSLKNSIDKLLAKNHLKYYESEEYQVFFLPFIDKLWPLNYKPTRYLDSLARTDFTKELKEFQRAVKEIQTKLPDSLKLSASYVALDNLAEFANEIANQGKRLSHDIREEQMASNLKWLVQTKYPYEKIIVWAANTHIMKNTQSSFKNPGLNTVTMGGYFTSDSTLSSQTYVLGFTSNYGKTQTALKASQNTPPLLIRKSRKYGFENWIDKEIKYAFIDFQAFKRKNPLFMSYFKLKARGHSNMAARWTELFDGIFYIREMHPSHFLKNSN
ncbi:erythromycin esterase family protein [Telluribacter humicola]|uniref:erythromycin esterase family protein n=1 Tax=Telluribacter humicola TaxID=1720261 RepID=UPI001A95CAAD|nr:erythromycin esterase family protein [Telluribacter humicola]